MAFSTTKWHNTPSVFDNGCKMNWHTRPALENWVIILINHIIIRNSQASLLVGVICLYIMCNKWMLEIVD